MSLGDAEAAYLRDLFSDIPDLATRKMFGGLGVYAGDVIFAVMRSDGVILLKAPDGPFADRLEGMGAEKWTFTRKSGTQSSMPYRSLPSAAHDDPDLANRLAREALANLAD